MVDLDRFVAAQDAGGTYASALAELRGGRKSGHWMWFVFPQIAGLGRSETAARFALGGVDEARAYLAHPVLGPRLVGAAQAVLDSAAVDADSLLGAVDAVKLRSSMTLFEAAAGADAAQADDASGGPVAWSVFAQVLDRYYAGRRDHETLRRL